MLLRKQQCFSKSLKTAMHCWQVHACSRQAEECGIPLLHCCFGAMFASMSMNGRLEMMNRPTVCVPRERHPYYSVQLDMSLQVPEVGTRGLTLGMLQATQQCLSPFCRKLSVQLLSCE